MKLNEAAEALTRLEAELKAYQHAMGVLSFDGATIAPKNAAAGRGETLGFLGGVYHERMTSPRTREILETITAGCPDRVLFRRAEVLKEESDDLLRVPAEEYIAYEKLTAEADAVWHEAKNRSDWESFAPYLDRIVSYNRRLGERRNPGGAAYDGLLDMYEKGASMAQLDPFFALLRKELTPLILEIGRRPAPDTGFLHQTFPVWQQRIFSDRLMQLMGINRDDCSIAETEHPFTDGSSKHDVRITTHYYERDVASSMYSVIHEGGHALYDLGSGDELEGTSLAGGSTMGIHESQSRFYENIIGRSRAFMDPLLPLMREIFPEQMKGVDEDKLYRAVNRAEPSLIRTEADELTYAMHIMVRYELEKAMLAGELKTADLPGEWNAMYKKYLGIDVPDHCHGVLQDGHWAGGAIGYFHSYALGSAYGAQMLKAMEHDVDVWSTVSAGSLEPVTAWLRERIHRHGKLLTPAELFRSAAGAEFDPWYFIRYLKEKFGALYGLN